MVETPKGRKKFAVDFWKLAPADNDPDWTSYSDDRDALVKEAGRLRDRFYAAILYERNLSLTPDWDIVEKRYWRKHRQLWPENDS